MYKFLNEQVSTFQKDVRTKPIQYVQLHHNASTDGRGVVQMMVSGSRQVSANCEQLSDGTSIEVVPREYRAWTSGSATYDQMAYTFETENASGAPGWTISDAAHIKIARAVAEIATAEGFPINRWTVYGHNEMIGRWGVSYSTACPGGMDIDRIVSLAIGFQSESTTRKKETLVRIVHEVDATQTKNLNFWAVSETDAWIITREQERILTLAFFASGMDVEGNFVRMQTADILAVQKLLRANAPAVGSPTPAQITAIASAIVTALGDKIVTDADLAIVQAAIIKAFPTKAVLS